MLAVSGRVPRYAARPVIDAYRHHGFAAPLLLRGDICSCQFKTWALAITGTYNEENFNENAGCRLVANVMHYLRLVPPSYAARLGCSPLVSLTSAGEKAWEPFIANFTAAVDCDPINTVTVYINQARPTFRQRHFPQSFVAFATSSHALLPTHSCAN